MSRAVVVQINAQTAWRPPGPRHER